MAESKWKEPPRHPISAHLPPYGKHAVEQFDALYQTHVERVYRYAYSRIGDVQAAEDVTAQTFLAALEGFDTLRAKNRFSSWLFGIARNKIMDHFRSLRRSVPLQEDAPSSEEEDPARLVTESDQVRQLSDMLASLPEDERELLRLRFLAQLSFAEMAYLLGRNEDAVKKSVYRLLARLQSQVEGSHE